MPTALPSPTARCADRSRTGLTVLAKEAIAEGALALTLGAPDGGRLPDWSPGAHIDLHLGEGRTRQYSLCGDPQSIDFVEVGFPDAPAALDRGQVDAAWILDPFLTQALEDGARAVSYNYVEFHPELDIAGYFTTAQKFEEDPELVESFQNAMNRSLEYANESPEEVREIVGTYTKISDELREQVALPRFRAEFDREALQKLGDAAVEHGTLEESPDLDALLP